MIAESLIHCDRHRESKLRRAAVSLAIDGIVEAERCTIMPDHAIHGRNKAGASMKTGIIGAPQELVRVARLSAGLDIFKPRSWIAALRLGFAVMRPT